MPGAEWTPDVLGAPYSALTLPMRPDDEGEVVATLVSRPADGPTRRAVLHVHGFADYFFQTLAADWWAARGYDFYALDLRKYGRSLRPHQTPNHVTDLAAHYEELDAAYALVRADHDQVVLSAHSTGGLTVPLWLHDRRHHVAGVVLNAPWLDMAASWLMRTLGTRVLDVVGARRPMLVIPREVSGFYARSLHRDYDGEWDFDLRWKPLDSFPVHTGWLRAVRRGHARVQRGLDVRAPVLVLSSSLSSHPETYDDRVHRTDIVLDVEQIRHRAPRLARHVTVVQVDGAIHDVTLSPRPARDAVFDELGRWLTAYAEG